MRLSVIEIIPVFTISLLAGILAFWWGKARYALEISPAWRAILALAGSAVCVGMIVKKGLTIESVLYSPCPFILLLIGIIDEKTFEIPAELNLFIGILGGIRMLFDLPHWKEYVIGMGAVSSLLLIMALATRGKGMGGGDVKLMAAAGLLLGYKGIFPALLAGCLLGVFAHPLRMKLSGKGKAMALGPYLSFGILTVLIWGDEILQWYAAL